MRNNKGFSLVELIVVIAIMAILAAVAVAGFSMYIPKAQQSNDRQLISDIEYSMTLAGYNGDFEEGETGVIILSTSGITTENENAIAVLQSMYGADYATAVKLAYDSWDGAVISFQESSYSENVDQLVGTVTNLTGALSGFMEDENFSTAVFGSNFNGYLGGLGIDPTTDPTAASNAAVLYVAQNTAGKEDVVKSAVNTAIDQVNNNPDLTPGTEDWANAVVDAMSENLTGELGTAGGMAAMYAYAEAFGQYHSSQEGNTSEALDDFHEATTFEGIDGADGAKNLINGAFVDLLMAGSGSVQGYLNTDSGKSQSEKDLEGYVTALNRVNQSSTTLKNNLGSTEAFTQTASGLLDMYMSVGEGEVGIMFRYTDGVMTFTSTIPEN